MHKPFKAHKIINKSVIKRFTYNKENIKTYI